jgi:hypothetical protein
MDGGQDDLVLHEGDGKIQRPSKINLIGKAGLKIQKMPSPRKVAPATTRTRTRTRTRTTTTTRTTTAEGATKKQKPKVALNANVNAEANPSKTSSSSSSSAAASQKPEDKNKNKNNNNNNGNNGKPGKEDFFAKMKHKSKLVASNDFFEADSLDGDPIFQDWDDDDRRGRSIGMISRLDGTTFGNTSQQESTSQHHSEQKPSYELSSEDIEICQRLDEEYERALEERDIGYNARYSSVRQTAGWSIFFLVVYIVQGTFVYRELLLLNNIKNYIPIEREEGEEYEDEFDNEFSNWSVAESLFFSIFTITTVGYGREDLPTTPSFQAYTIVYIMVGIAALTIMVAQVYQCIALEASRARLSQDKQDELRRRSGLMLEDTKQRKITVSSPSNGSSANGGAGKNERENSDEIITSYRDTGLVPRSLDSFFRHLDRVKFFFRETELGRGISVILPFAGLILSGACVVCLLEEWTFLESLYFAVVSLTTVGFGDYVPTKLPTIWFCIFWLPFSIGFMSMYLSNIATFYIRLSDRNIRRIERNLRRRLQKAKEKAEEERAQILQRAYRGQEVEIEIAAGGADGGTLDDVRGEMQRSGSIVSNGSAEEYQQATIPKSHARSVMKRQRQEGFNMLPTTDDDYNSDDDTVLIGVATNSENAKMGDTMGRSCGHRRRQKIIDNCRVIPSAFGHNSDGNGNDKGEGAAGTNPDLSNDRTMKSMKDVIRAVRNTLDSKNSGDSDASKFMSLQSNQNMIDYSIFRRQNQSKKPSFALRVLIQERFAEIIAIEVAGFHSSIEIKNYTLSVTIESLSETAEKWWVPRRARKAFRAVAFEILYFVGEHGLITRGADALYELTPFEFHGLFSTLVAAMGDADIMEGWLAKTDALAMVDLQQGVLHRSAPDDEGMGGMRKRVFSID